MKQGDVVLLTLGGKDFNALVHQVNEFDRSHLGANGEPTLHLSYIPDDPIDTATRKPKSLPIGQIRQSVILYDVVHASHTFHELYVQKHSIKSDAELVARRGMGEWREALVGEMKEIVAMRSIPSSNLPHVTNVIDIAPDVDLQNSADAANPDSAV